jgi:hypothetical protein
MWPQGVPDGPGGSVVGLGVTDGLLGSPIASVIVGGHGRTRVASGGRN